MMTILRGHMGQIGMNKKLFGAWITYTHTVDKYRRQIIESKNVVTTAHPASKVISGPKKALLIGERFLQNGRTHYSGDIDEYGQAAGGFTVTGTTHCLVVVTNPRRNPIWVAIEGAMLPDGTTVKDVM